MSGLSSISGVIVTQLANMVLLSKTGRRVSSLTGPATSSPDHFTGSLSVYVPGKKTGGFLASAVETIDQSQPSDALGALFGLNALSNELRNVSVHNATVDWQPPSIDLGENNLPFDPYV